MCGALHIFKLAALHGPQKDERNGRHENQAEGNQKIKDVHRLALLSGGIVFVT